MSLKIAIQPDETKHHSGERQSYSERWIELARNEGSKRLHAPSVYPQLHVKRLLYAVQEQLRNPVYSSLKGSWHLRG